jgi:hypothetical protein
MRSSLLAGFALCALAPFALAKDEAPPPPPPPTTPLPTFENPLHDAKVGETLRYRVIDAENLEKPSWTRYFEERVLAKKAEQVLLETVETNEAGDKIFSIDPQRSGWRPAPATFKLGDHQKWKKEKERQEVVVVGQAQKRSVRCTHRVLDEPESFANPEGRRRERRIWYSHDVPCSGRVKEWPAQNEGERLAISWDKTLSATECAERAKKYKDPEDEEKKKKEEEERKKKEEEGEKKEPDGGSPSMDD